MSTQFTVIAVIFSLFLFLAAAVGLYILRNMFIPSRGRKIGKYQNPAKALLVLDIQESGHAPDVPFPAHTRLGRMITAVNRLIDGFEQAGGEIAYVRQVFTNNFVTRLHGGRILAGRLEPRICRWVKVVNGHDFAKNRTDAFSNRQLERFLIDRQVTEIFLVGLDAAFCVYYTALGALNRGYRVTVVSDAVMTGRDINKVLERFHRKGIAVISSAELCEYLQIGNDNRPGGAA